MAHYPGHLIAGAAALVVALAISSFTSNRLVRRKLRVSLVLLGAYVIGHVVGAVRPDLWPVAESKFYSFETLALAAALINLFVVALLNPLREDRAPDRFPSIVQDAVVIGLLLLMATFALGTDFIATSAVSAVVLGFALQDTLGNAIAGLAIQSEKPFKIGHWVKVGDFEGRVMEVTWRATKIRTKTGNFIIVPNSVVGKDPIINYSEPVAPTRLQVDVGVHYDTPPTKVKAVLHEALRQCPLVLSSPPPEIELASFAPSSIDYAVRFWIDDFARDEVARDQARTAIYYAFRRHDIEIPYPIQTEISIDPAVRDDRVRAAEREQVIAGVDLFTSLAEDQRRTIAAATTLRMFGDGERIVREGDPGQSMYVVRSGEVDVVIAAQKEPIARISRGGYFGEMSLLTGDPRSASVVARGDVDVLEIDAEVFRQLGEVSPHAVEQVAIAAATRRTELDGVRASTQASAVIEAPKNLVARMRRFLRLR